MKDAIEGSIKFENIAYTKSRKDMVNQLTRMLGAKDVPLSYAVFPEVISDPDDLVGMSFLASTLLQDPVDGETFEAYYRIFHQLIFDSATGTEVEDFLLAVALF